jgi:glycosyltransferase involved in cell wall biosynthesis
LQATEEAVLQGQAALREVAALIETGLRPRVIVTHGGMGMGLFVKDLLPEALHIGYFEWYFRAETTRHLLPSFSLDDQLKTSLRNLPILQELEACDLAVIPTEWQKKQFPAAYHRKLNVIFDGVDQSFFRPPSAKEEDEEITLTNRDTGEELSLPRGRKVLSYATRGMEPLRGFPEFLRAASTLVGEFSDLEVVIAGADRRAYSFDAPTHSGSWKMHVLDGLGAFHGQERLHFTGLLSYPDYRSLLWRSNLHCYFTRPYVTSWSLFEAAACSARLAVSRGPATANIAKLESVRWVDLEDQASIIGQLREGLRKGTERSELLEGYGLLDNLKKWESMINRGLRASSIQGATS